MAIVPERGPDGQWAYKSIFINRLLEVVWGWAPRPSKLSEAQQRRLYLGNRALFGTREQQRGASGIASHSETGSLHVFFDRGLMRPHPGVFGIVLRRGIEHRKAFGGFGGLTQCHLENFGEVQRVAVRFLRNLLAATETVGDDEPVGGSLANAGQDFDFADRFRDIVFFFFETDRSRHAAASGGGSGEVDA